MPRIARLINSRESTCYHVISRTALDGLPFGDVENDQLMKRDRTRLKGWTGCIP